MRKGFSSNYIDRLCRCWLNVGNYEILFVDSGNLKITNLDRLIFTKNGEFTI